MEVLGLFRPCFFCGFPIPLVFLFSQGHGEFVDAVPGHERGGTGGGETSFSLLVTLVVVGEGKYSTMPGAAPGGPGRAGTGRTGPGGMCVVLTLIQWVPGGSRA